MKTKWIVVVMAMFLSIPSMASADELNMNVQINVDETEAEPPPVRFSLGFRIGGYGFKHLNEKGNTDWTACRMNGVGIFGTVDVGQHFFTELSLDAYHTTSEPEKNGIERKSAHTQLAVGARFFPDWFITPNIHAGGGAEFTYAEVYGADTFTVAPVGFVGVGGEINLGDFKLGMALRSLVMPIPEYDWNAVNTGVVDWEMEFAGQALFTARYVF